MTEEQKKRKQAYDIAYAKNNLDRIIIQAQKTINLPGRLKMAVEAGKAPSRQAYIINALISHLKKDGL